jgi:hypothetical protein
VLFGLHVFPLTGRTLVPIAGMMVGNSMTATILAGRRLTDELRDKRDEVEARLALGQPSRQAATPYVRAALRAALTPQIETTKATGLVFLPGAMTGLILAGAAPLQAVLVQAVVMFLVLAATATTTVVIALGLIRRLFTPDHRLAHLPTPADRLDPHAVRLLPPAYHPGRHCPARDGPGQPDPVPPRGHHQGQHRPGQGQHGEQQERRHRLGAAARPAARGGFDQLGDGRASLTSEFPDHSPSRS